MWSCELGLEGDDRRDMSRALDRSDPLAFHLISTTRLWSNHLGDPLRRLGVRQRYSSLSGLDSTGRLVAGSLFPVMSAKSVVGKSFAGLALDPHPSVLAGGGVIRGDDRVAGFGDDAEGASRIRSDETR